MAILRAESTQPNQALDFLHRARQRAQALSTPNAEIQFWGLCRLLMERRKGRYRYYFQVEATQRADLQRFLGSLAQQLETEKRFSNVRWSLDVDPQEF